VAAEITSERKGQNQRKYGRDIHDVTDTSGVRDSDRDRESDAGYGQEWGDASDTTDTGGGSRWDAKTMMADAKDHTSIRDLERAVVRKDSIEEFSETNTTSTQEVTTS